MESITQARPGQVTPEGISSDAAIAAHQLTKTYRFHRQQPGLLGALRSVIHRETDTRLAVDAISFEIAPGEVVGLLGPNGAGKTTTLKMLTGLLYPSSGELSVLGYRPSDRPTAYLRRIALVMGQKSMLWWDVPAMESLLLHKEMYGIDQATFDESVAELAELLDVRDLLSVPVRKLSLGERMKMELVAAMVHRPDVLFLDEPTIGLDVVAKARVRSFLADVNRLRGTTILITSHDMDDIEALCNRVMIINHGRIAYDGGLVELVRSVQPRKRIRATYESPVSPISLGGIATVVPVEDDDGRVLALEAPREQMSEVLSRLPLLGALVDLEVNDAEVEEIIRDLFVASRAPREGGVA